jgi:hypothetical protein
MYLLKFALLLANTLVNETNYCFYCCCYSITKLNTTSYQTNMAVTTVNTMLLLNYNKMLKLVQLMVFGK